MHVGSPEGRFVIVALYSQHSAQYGSNNICGEKEGEREGREEGRVEGRKGDLIWIKFFVLDPTIPKNRAKSITKKCRSDYEE